jgi:hypothetical protein
MKKIVWMMVSVLFIATGCAYAKSAQTLIMVFDGAGENNNCDEIAQSNYDMAKELVSPESLRQNRVHTVYGGVFSQRTLLNWGALFPRRGSDRSRYNRLSNSALRVIEDTKRAMADFYAYKDASGNEKYYPRDVKGMIDSVLHFIDDKHLENVRVVVFSDMKQTFNKRATMQRLGQNHICLPDGVKLEIYAKSLVCDYRGSQAQVEEVLQKRKNFWMSVIKPASSVSYRTSY